MFYATMEYVIIVVKMSSYYKNISQYIGTSWTSFQSYVLSASSKIIVSWVSASGGWLIIGVPEIII